MRTLAALCLITSLVGAQGVMPRAMEAFKAKDYKMVVALVRPLASAGDGSAQAMLGYMLREGLGCEKDISGALRWLRKAADQDDGHALFRLSQMYLRGTGVKPNKRQAMALLKRSAYNLHPLGLFWYGQFLTRGSHGLKSDIEVGVQYIRRAGSRGMIPAQLAMLQVHRQGVLGKRNYDRAAAWAAMAASTGHEDSLKFLKKMHEDDVAGATFELGRLMVIGRGVDLDVAGGLALVRTAAQQKYGDAHWFLGECHLVGRAGLEKDTRRARADFTTAAAEGSRDGLFRLGFCQWMAIGGEASEKPNTLGLQNIIDACKQRSSLAITWLRAESDKGNLKAASALADLYLELGLRDAIPILERLARNGDADAQYKIGLLLKDKHPTAAADWLVKASRAGNKDAHEEIGLLVIGGKAKIRDRKAVFLGLQALAKKDNVDALYELSVLYEQGRGVAKDPALALKHLSTAAAAGHAQALERLAAGAQRGDVVYQRAYGLLLALDPKTKDEAAKMLLAPAKSGDVASQVALGELTGSREWLEKAASSENADAMFALARHLLRAGDFPAARRWMESAERAGSTAAAMHMVELDARSNGKAYTSALVAKARAGDERAAFDLARIHAHGWAGKPDLKGAYMWMLMMSRMAETDPRYSEYRKVSEMLLNGLTPEQRKAARDEALRLRKEASRAWIRGLVAKLQAKGEKTIVIIDVGDVDGVKIGMRGRIEGVDARFTVIEVFAKQCKAEIPVSVKAIGSNRKAVIAAN